VVEVLSREDEFILWAVRERKGWITHAQAVRIVAGRGTNPGEIKRCCRYALDGVPDNRPISWRRSWIKHCWLFIEPGNRSVGLDQRPAERCLDVAALEVFDRVTSTGLAPIWPDVFDGSYTQWIDKDGLSLWAAEYMGRPNSARDPVELRQALAEHGRHQEIQSRVPASESIRTRQF
jgi:hypothetical protein